ncbi:MAG: class I SAM-dependent methyltransferase [Methanosarcinaceae archaeon]
MAHKLTIEPQSVQETMFLPVWGRAKYSHLYPELLDDPRAEEIMGKIDYDFSKVEKGFDENSGIGWLVRARNFDDAIKEYIKKYPEATIINLGAGLDTTFFRVDNGKIAWYDLDLPDAIDFRKKLIPETSRSECIAKSAFDVSWFDDLDYEEEKGIYIIAGGFFYYFEEPEIRRLVSSMAESFPDGGLIFDAISKAGLWFTNRMVKKTGNTGAEVHFSLVNPVKRISRWSGNIKVAEWYPYWHGIKRDPRWSKNTIFKMNFCDWFKMAKFVQLRFIK